MAQPRRVQLTSLPTDVQSCAVNGAVLAPKSQPEPGGASPLAAHCGSGVIRLVVSLFEPDERSFAEFSYTQLVENKWHNVQDEVETRSRFEVGDQSEKQHMASSLMRNLEKKYKVKKKRDRVQDLIDIGYGYDDEDSFIDNSEAYDEFVPSSITTKFGGFYVNSGVLHFCQISDTETDDGTTGERTPKTTKKRGLKDGQELPKKKRRRNVVPDKNGVDASSSMASDEQMKKKKKKLSGTLSVTSMLKKFRREKELERKKMERTRQRMARTPLTPVTAQCPADTGGGGSGLADPLLSLIGSTDEQALLQAASTVEFDIDLDCLLDVGDEIATPLMEPPPPEQQRAEHRHLPEASYDATLSPSRKMTQPQKPHPEVASSYQCVALPEGLPPALEDSIKKLMLAAKTSEGESKLKFFTPEINAVLLDIERKCREHGGQLRSRVYTHLSFFLPCSKETLLKRVKKLKLAEGFSNVEDPMQKLKDAIARAMPEQITHFNQHCQEYEQVKTLRTMEDGSDVRQGGQGNNLEEKGTKRGGGPKKLFKWNEEIREVLHHVLREKLSVFQNKSDGGQQREEYLKTLLVKDVKPLWPKGWMQSRVLLSESRKILGLQLMFPKRSRSEKRKLSITAPSVSDQNTRPLPLKLELPYEANSVVEQASSASRVTTEDTEVIVLDSDSSPTPNDELAAIVCEQAPVHMDSQATPSELFAAAITKYKSSLQYWNLSVANGTPPLPPPPPQCSPVNFPEGSLSHVAVPKLQDLLGTPTDLGPDLQRGSDVIL